MKATFWDRKAKTYDGYIQNHDSLYNKTIDSTKSLLTKSDVVLDFACASGEISLDIAPHVQYVHGIDLSKNMVILANQKTIDRQADNINFEQIDIFDQKLVKNSFSAILALDIFHLLDDAPTVLARLHDLLSVGGLLISQTPCLSERGWFFRSLVRLFQNFGLAPMFRNFTVTELETLVSGCNFEIVETKLWDTKWMTQRIVAKKL
jgi:2-polyprenyl-3-methyl-5-hydroxy-6-metoxy-1,4-benzoquinol methylase